MRRNVLLSAARQAGLGARLVLEPVAAAAHFASFPGRSLGPGQALAVYDLGAGTFDVAVVSGSVVLAESGLPDLGGLDVDQALLSHVARQVSGRDPAGWQRLLRPSSTADRRAQRALREDIRAAKESLSSHPQTDVPLPEPFEDVLMTRAELEALIRPNLLRSVELLDATVRSAGLSRDRLAGVYLVGGSSRIPLVATLIAEQLRIVPTNLDQPETAVALGAHHVAAEGTSLRTGNLPDIPATADERTVHLSPPPRTSVRPRPEFAPPRGQPTPAAVLPASFPRHAETPVAPPQLLMNKPKNTKKLWAIIAACLGVAVVAAVIIWQFVEAMPRNDVTVAHPKELPDDLPCGSIISIEEVGEEFGVDAQEFDTSERCNWAARDSANNPVPAGLSVDRWYTTEESFILHGNAARENRFNDACHVEIAIQADKAMMIRARGQDGRDSCDLARALLAIAFDNLPNA